MLRNDARISISKLALTFELELELFEHGERELQMSGTGKRDVESRQYSQRKNVRNASKRHKQLTASRLFPATPTADLAPTCAPPRRRRRRSGEISRSASIECGANREQRPDERLGLARPGPARPSPAQPHRREIMTCE